MAGLPDNVVVLAFPDNAHALSYLEHEIVTLLESGIVAINDFPASVLSSVIGDAPELHVEVSKSKVEVKEAPAEEPAPEPTGGDDEPAPDDDDQITVSDLRAMPVAQLREVMITEFSYDPSEVKGVKKDDLIASLLEDQA